MLKVEKVLYLLLAITLVITAVGVVKITPLLSDNINNSTKGNLIISSSSGIERANSPDINMKTPATQGAGYSSFLASLPCFKCHEMDAWRGDTDSGGFSHVFHIEMELHCLDCHAFIAHGEGMTVAVETCSGCHG